MQLVSLNVDGRLSHGDSRGPARTSTVPASAAACPGAAAYVWAHLVPHVVHAGKVLLPGDVPRLRRRCKQLAVRWPAVPAHRADLEIDCGPFAMCMIHAANYRSILRSWTTPKRWACDHLMHNGAAHFGTGLECAQYIMECVSFHNFSSSARWSLDAGSGSWGMSFRDAASSSTTVVDAGSSSTGALALLCKMLETEACSFSLAVSSIKDATLRPERASHARINPVATSSPKVRYVQGRRLLPRPALPGRGRRLNLGIRSTAALQHHLINCQQSPVRLLRIN